MNRILAPEAPPARLTLRAHFPAPARVELIYQPVARRVAWSLLAIAVCWGGIPFLLWIPPHYPWAASAFCGGAYLAYRSWTGRYRVRSFAGICPRCGSPLSLGVDRTIDLPHTLTCFSCHFEPKLEIDDLAEEAGRDPLAHQSADCVGTWSIRWLADEPFVFCSACHAGVPATQGAREQADRENERGDILGQLTNEGWPLV